MNGAHNYHKNIKMYVLRCTTIGLKQECGHKTSRRAEMNLRFMPHFMAKICQFFVPTSQKIRLCVDVIWRHSCSYVAYRYVYLCPYWEGYTNIYRVIAIILLTISPNLPGWAIIEELSIRRQSQGSTLIFLAGCPKSHFPAWYRNFLVYWYLKLDNQVFNSTCLKDKLGWIWRANDP